MLLDQTLTDSKPIARTWDRAMLLDQTLTDSKPIALTWDRAMLLDQTLTDSKPIALTWAYSEETKTVASGYVAKYIGSTIRGIRIERNEFYLVIIKTGPILPKFRIAYI